LFTWANLPRASSATGHFQYDSTTVKGACSFVSAGTTGESLLQVIPERIPVVHAQTNVIISDKSTDFHEILNAQSTIE
jgi:hypothetical protein